MKRIFSVLFVITVFFCICSEVYAEQDSKENVLSTVLAEATTGNVIMSENGSVRMSQGSLCKLMTILLTAEEIADGNISTDTVLTTSANANTQKGAVIWLMQSEKITVDELLKAVIIGNANDACIVLAEHIGQTEQEFIGMMNARAFELGMRNTVYKSCTGNADIDGQYSTAEDTAKLACELLKHDFLCKYFTTWIENVRDGQTELVNENKLVRTYEGITGMKAGRSEQSGYSLVLSAERDGASFISIVMGCDDKDERFGMAKSLMGTGFSSFKVTTPAFSDEFLRPVSVHGGKQTAVMIRAEKLEELVIPKSCSDLSTAVLIPNYINAPVKKGQLVGRVGFYNGDSLLYETNLVACDAVEKADFVGSVKKVLSIMYK
ncbi:MAG: D-alanyl-D-alanine carboxypeptidase [Oscillospiraceae bacterium]|nr:D-alanyl-D-alanine carboxypeptidase [Oscillospiraceae bacterium]